MDLPELSPTDVETMGKVDGWNARLAVTDKKLKIVAGAQTVIQLSDRSRVF